MSNIIRTSANSICFIPIVLTTTVVVPGNKWQRDGKWKQMVVNVACFLERLPSERHAYSGMSRRRLFQ